MDRRTLQERHLPRGTILSSISGLVLAAVLAHQLVADSPDRAQRPSLGEKAQPTSEDTEIGTALVTHYLACDKAGDFVLDIVTEDKELQITVPSIYSQTGSFTIGFSQQGNEYRVDMPGYEDPIYLEEMLESSAEGITQPVAINVNENLAVAFRIFRAADDIDGLPGISTLIEAKCITQEEAAKIPTGPNSTTSTGLDTRPF